MPEVRNRVDSTRSAYFDLRAALRAGALTAELKLTLVRTLIDSRWCHDSDSAAASPVRGVRF
eukprot:6863391-Lingulodinium_polyedra.AAC.1